MPGGNGTGPMGMGSMTGRGMGFCAGYVNSGFGMGRGPGRGFGRGMGRGLGMRLGGRVVPQYGASDQAMPEVDVLKAQADEYQAALKNIQGRIEELGAKETGN